MSVRRLSGRSPRTSILVPGHDRRSNPTSDTLSRWAFRPAGRHRAGEPGRKSGSISWVMPPPHEIDMRRVPLSLSRPCVMNSLVRQRLCPLSARAYRRAGRYRKRSDMPVITQLFDQLVQHMTNLFHMRFEFCETLFCGLAAHCFIPFVVEVTAMRRGNTRCHQARASGYSPLS